MARGPLKVVRRVIAGSPVALLDLNKSPAEKPARPSLIAVRGLSRMLAHDRHGRRSAHGIAAAVQDQNMKPRTSSPETPRTIDLVGILEEQIALGQLAPCTRLVEEEIAKRYQVNRYTVRQALSDLEVMGVVVSHPNRGASVRDYTVQEVEQLYVVRSLIEQRAAELIPLPADRKVIGALRKIHARHTVAVEKGDLRTAFRENLLFHRTFFALCGNVPLIELIDQMALRTHAIRSYSIGDPLLLKLLRDQHQLMIDLLETRDRRSLVDLVVQHIQPAKDAYLRLARHML